MKKIISIAIALTIVIVGVAFAEEVNDIKSFEDLYQSFMSKSLPGTLDTYFANSTPEVPKSEWLGEMFIQAGAFEGIAINLQEQDWANVSNSYNTFAAEYKKISNKIPDWNGYFDIATVDKLGKDINNKDITSSFADLGIIGTTCSRCHQDRQPQVWAKYYWRDFGTVQVDGKKWKDSMFDLAGAFDGIAINTAEGKQAEANDSFNKFKQLYTDFKTACSNCHDSPRYYYVSDDVFNQIDNMGDNITSGNLGNAAIIQQQISVQCYKCHVLHMPAQDMKAQMVIPPIILTISPSITSIPINNTINFTAKDQSGNTVNATWDSSNTTVGTIDANNGTFTSLTIGTTTITGTANISGSTVIGTETINVTSGVGVSGLLTLSLNSTMDGNANTSILNNITNAVLLDTEGNIAVSNAVIPDNRTAEFSLNGLEPGDYFIELNNLSADLLPTRIDSNTSNILQIAGLRLKNSIIGNGNISNPTYRIKVYPSGLNSHPVVNYATGFNETKYAFVIVSGNNSKIEIRELGTSEEISNFSTNLATHDGQSVPFQTWILGDTKDVNGIFIGNHGIVYNGTDSNCNSCHVDLDTKNINFSDIAPTTGWCYRCHNGKQGPRNGFIDPRISVLGISITANRTNISVAPFNTTVKFTVMSGGVVVNNTTVNIIGAGLNDSEVTANDGTVNMTLLPTTNGTITATATIGSNIATTNITAKGDVSGDGKVSIIDALFIAQYTVGSRTLTPDQLLAADVTGDGKVNIVDALFIAQGTVNLPDRPIPQAGN